MKKPSTSEIILQLNQDAKSNPLISLSSWWRQHIFWLTISFSAGYLQFLVFNMEVQTSLFQVYPYFWVEISLLALLIILSSISALLLSRPGQGETFKIVPLATVGAWLIVLSWVIVTSQEVNSSSSFLNQIQEGCFRGVFFFSLLPTIVIFWMICKGASTRVGWASIMGSLAGGSVGYLMVRVECAYQDPFHLLYAHVLPAMLVISVGFFIGKKLVRW